MLQGLFPNLATDSFLRRNTKVQQSKFILQLILKSRQDFPTHPNTDSPFFSVKTHSLPTTPPRCYCCFLSALPHSGAAPTLTPCLPLRGNKSVLRWEFGVWVCPVLDSKGLSLPYAYYTSLCLKKVYSTWILPSTKGLHNWMILSNFMMTFMWLLFGSDQKPELLW